MTTTSEPGAVVMLGKPVADAIEARVAVGVAELLRLRGVVPVLAIVLVGSNEASRRYVNRKIEACARLGMRAELKTYRPDISSDDLKAEVAAIGRSPEFHGVLVQLPLPPHIEKHDAGTTNKFDVFDAIAPDKDVDGVGRDAVAALYRAQQERMVLMPGTALAVRRMMAFYGVRTEGKQAVVVGRNDITAKPILQMLGGRMCNAAAVWCHRYVSPIDQRRLVREADILVTAVGRSGYRITADMLKPGVAVFDVATRVDEAGKMHGDVDFEAARGVAGFITPVPRGIGPVTVAALCENTLRAAQFSAGVGRPGYSF
ncbi:MAG TPA: bifunctional 5,10-methylenetetrahydrofolate dehydrogenase/5,10-methenyltetrahydrofolate cyclohydrolase [Polyangiaceae bacterium]|nr:bifunctional 5,10-methylenetetrahydrofolate dehydrogenase/5,10-methenyltetrahydrofolate cyclohydrolase [Polyangiaceae bacterium]